MQWLIHNYFMQERKKTNEELSGARVINFGNPDLIRAPYNAYNVSTPGSLFEEVCRYHQINIS